MSKSITLILARHGNTFESNQTPVQIGLNTDLPLTEFGRQQIVSLKNYFLTHQIKLEAVYCGKLQRQVQSAEIIAQAFDLLPQYNIALDEIDYGLWEGLSLETIQSKWLKLHHDWETNAVWPEGIFEKV